MAIAQRTAEVVWEGTLARGVGALSTASGALELPVTWASRTERPDGKTSPEELIAAAHASCFAMALALVLGENHTPPERLTVTAACTLDEVDGAPRITTAALSVGARVSGLDRAGLRRNVEQAADLCPVSNALRGNVEISVRDELDDGWSRETAVLPPAPRHPTPTTTTSDSRRFLHGRLHVPARRAAGGLRLITCPETSRVLRRPPRR